VENSFVSNLPFALMIFGAGEAHGKFDFLNTRLIGAKLVGPDSSVEVTCK
jgi:hypothetical protein